MPLIPLFMDPAGGNYHLVRGSLCIDAGTTVAWLTTDLDGDSRPQGADYDIGADEFRKWQVYLPVVMRSHP